ncbi:T9SS type A sorting domain-containing protein [Polaribacter ponticola]|uniref:T9SS type A sorting domain-containing protein n=1 Tax=Polaribacter ponticola TaxID=2978475 RepID=A0ABT5SAU5_9FLAO|nr:T9SS type A sorting domain-containing protein [Polaribacter sp. MSW5]MDD7914596.1 T9SS type A sorting domain-containing protein [Polaribacter sp. MSW5]
MMKKLLLLLFFTISTIVFSQEKSIENLSAAPNPFTNSTKISFNAINSSTIILNVKNVLGKTVFKKTYKTKLGKNAIPFYKNDLSTGIYIYSIQDKNKITSKRFVIK